MEDWVLAVCPDLIWKFTAKTQLSESHSWTRCLLIPARWCWKSQGAEAASLFLYLLKSLGKASGLSLTPHTKDQVGRKRCYRSWGKVPSSSQRHLWCRGIAGSVPEHQLYANQCTALRKRVLAKWTHFLHLLYISVLIVLWDQCNSRHSKAMFI